MPGGRPPGGVETPPRPSVDPERLARREAARRDLVRRRRRVLLVAALVPVAVAAWFLVSLFQPFHGDGSGRVQVTIPRASSLGQIADLLERRGVVSSSFFFEARATISGHRGDLKAGTYQLRRDMSYGSVLGIITRAPSENVVSVTVPEGLSRREVAPLAARDGLRGSYAAATERSPLLDPARYGARRARSLEGFLFPATYEVKRGPVKGLVDKQLTAFKQRFATVDLRAARRVNLTPYDVLTIASLVEREAEVAREKPLVAAVIYNRLRAGMFLGIDATTRFALGKWSGALRRSELASPSPYNTRNHKGLPPGPIGNPGIQAIQAAAHPAHVGYLYYVANPCKPGTHVFATSAAAFDRAVARYQDARRKAGGRAPKGC